jgi:hypothetical protein
MGREGPGTISFFIASSRFRADLEQNPMISYTVRGTFKNREVSERWLSWLVDGHLAEVLEAGAVGAMAIKLDGEPPVIEARYLFASRESFDAYLRLHAPRLRAQGLALFPVELGLRYDRSVGEVVAES